MTLTNVFALKGYRETEEELDGAEGPRRFYFVLFVHADGNYSIEKGKLTIQEKEG